MDRNKIDQSFQVYFDALSRLIACESVLDEAGEAPFGSGINQALDTALEIAASWGYEVFRAPDGTYGYAEVGAGDKTMGVLGHVDVVSAGDFNAWSVPPFALTLKDGMLYGRGVQDDKGPVLATMFALKLLLDSGKTLTHKVRFIFGTDEESHWRCMERYKEDQPLPDFGITPDADFPLVQVEKGTVSFSIEDPLKRSDAFEGGVSGNAVPNSATIKTDDALVAALADANRDYEVKGDTLYVKGVSAHASTPEKGRNAIVHLAKARAAIGKASPLELFVVDLYTVPMFDRFYDEVSGYLTHNVGIARVDDAKQYVTLDIRFPVSFKQEEVVSIVESYAHKHGLIATVTGGLPGIQIPDKSEVFKALYSAYQEVTQDTTTKPLKIGGATYARAMPNIVAYGMLLPDAPMTMHQVDESIAVEDVKKAIEIYATAFEKLVF